LLSVLPHDPRRRLHPNAATTALVDVAALGRNAPDDVLPCRCNFAATSETVVST